MLRRPHRALKIFAIVVVLGLASAMAVRGILAGTVSVTEWTPFSGDPGGWSGIEVADDGVRFWLVGDNGDWAEGRTLRDATGYLTGAEVARSQRLLLPDGRPIRPPWQDTEGLALGPDGSFYISREWQHGIERLPQLGTRPTRLPRAPAFRTMPGNVGLEAVAVDATGAIYTLQERPGPLQRTTPLFRFTPDAGWQIVADLPRDGQFSISGADFAPDGALYLLERRFVGIGFTSRIRRVDLAAAPARIATLYHSPPGRHGNLEGMALWQDAQGRLRALMVSDNNRLTIQRQQLVEVILPPLP